MSPEFPGIPEYVRFVGIGDGRLGGSDDCGNEMRFEGIGMDAVVEFGKRAIQVPGKRQTSVFVFLETLELLDEVELELN